MFKWFLRWANDVREHVEGEECGICRFFMPSEVEYFLGKVQGFCAWRGEPAQSDGWCRKHREPSPPLPPKPQPPPPPPPRKYY